MMESTLRLISGSDKLMPAHAEDMAGPKPATRIHLDEDASGAYLYRLVDVATGRVLVERPRERAHELWTEAGEAAGQAAV